MREKKYWDSNGPHATTARLKQTEEKEMRHRNSAIAHRQDDMYVRDFSSMYSDECSESTVKDIRLYIYIYIRALRKVYRERRETRANHNLLHDPLAIIGGSSRLRVGGRGWELGEGGRGDLWFVGKLVFPRTKGANATQLYICPTISCIYYGDH